eukprot:COSAG01_NODE_14902_length_1397_cov_1.434515_2_plen_65_part_00
MDVDQYVELIDQIFFNDDDDDGDDDEGVPSIVKCSINTTTSVDANGDPVEVGMCKCEFSYAILD